MLLDSVFFSDDRGLFHLSGYVNKQLMRFWVLEQPHKHVHRPISVEKVSVHAQLDAMASLDHTDPTMKMEDGLTPIDKIDLKWNKFISALRRKRGERHCCPSTRCSTISRAYMSILPNDSLISCQDIPFGRRIPLT